MMYFVIGFVWLMMIILYSIVRPDENSKISKKFEEDPTRTYEKVESKLGGATNLYFISMLVNFFLWPIGMIVWVSLIKEARRS